MKLVSLRMTNFRNYQDYLFKPDSLTIISGPNGVGKTNIIEAVRFLTLLKSFRARRQTEAINWAQEYLRLEGKIKLNTKEIKIEIYQDRVQKQVKIKEVKKNVASSLGYFKTVLFNPEDLMMIGGAPSLRRRFLDILLSQKDSVYLRTLVAYYQVVRNRNQVLVRIAAHLSEQDELEFWNERLLELGVVLQQKRRELADFFNQYLSLAYQKISGQNQDLSFQLKDRPLDPELLKNGLALDLRLASTTLGPHHDDFMLELNGRNLASFGSRGEYRSALLALKVIESQFLAKNGDWPVVLLDDILSELDSQRRKHLFELFKEQQVIMTTTDSHLIDEEVRKKAKIINLSTL